jgi:hypothetical protein
MRYRKIDATELTILFSNWNVLHLDAMAVVHNDVIIAPGITAKPLPRRFGLNLSLNYWSDILHAVIGNGSHTEVSGSLALRLDQY